jgi:hypothetical protein
MSAWQLLLLRRHGLRNGWVWHGEARDRLWAGPISSALGYIYIAAFGLVGRAGPAVLIKGMPDHYSVSLTCREHEKDCRRIPHGGSITLYVKSFKRGQAN